MVTHVQLRYGQVAEINPETNMATVRGRCFVTHAEHQIEVPVDGLNRWIDGELIQKALPSLSPEDREFLLSGTSPAGWVKMFADRKG